MEQKSGISRCHRLKSSNILQWADLVASDGDLGQLTRGLFDEFLLLDVSAPEAAFSSLQAAEALRASHLIGQATPMNSMLIRYMCSRIGGVYCHGDDAILRLLKAGELLPPPPLDGSGDVDAFIEAFLEPGSIKTITELFGSMYGLSRLFEDISPTSIDVTSSTNVSISTSLVVETSGDWQHATCRQFNISLDRIDVFYRGIQEAIRTGTKEDLREELDNFYVNCISNIRGLCARLRARVKELVYPNQLRAIIVLLACPFFEEDWDMEGLEEFAGLLCELPPSSKEFLVRWLQHAPYWMLKQHVGQIQQLLSVRIMTAGNVTEESVPYLRRMLGPSLRTAAQVLGISYVANTRRCHALAKRRQQHIATSQDPLMQNGLTNKPAAEDPHSALPFCDFQNDAANANPLLVWIDYVDWIHLRTKMGSVKRTHASFEGVASSSGQSSPEFGLDELRNIGQFQAIPHAEVLFRANDNVLAPFHDPIRGTQDDLADEMISGQTSRVISDREGLPLVYVTAPWERFRHDQLPAQQHPITCFGFMQHPFLLNAVEKARALKRQSTLQQALQARRAEVGAFVDFVSGARRLSSALPFLLLRVRREFLVEDCLRQLAAKSILPHPSGSLKRALRVQFVGEEGIDEGGITKEFFQLIVEELFGPRYGMFIFHDETRYCWFNPFSFESCIHFHLVGLLFGLAIFNQQLLGVSFPPCLFKKLLGWNSNTLDDLGIIQPTVAESLRKLLQMPEDEVQDLGLSFCLPLDRYGEAVQWPLGDHKIDDPVLPQNREEFVSLYVKGVLDWSISKQYNAFYEGFSKVVDEAAISILTPCELQRIVLGCDQELSMDQLQKVTVYQDGYSSDSETVEKFWEVVHALPQEGKRKLLQFITGSDRVPIGGLSSIHFVIGRMGPDSDKLPTVRTCFNYLLLPDYKDQAKLKRLLGIALEHHQGFGLT